MSTSFVACSISLVLFVVVGIFVRRRQNQKPRMGGAISMAKCLWLMFALCVWFVWPLILFLTDEISSAYKDAFTLFLALIYTRGVIEVFMLLVTKNWRPPYGYVSHLLTALLMVVAAVLAPAGWREHADELWLYTLCLFTILLDAFYAWRFHAIVDVTTGDEGIWFAAEGDEKFRRINKITTFFNVVIYAAAAIFLVLHH